MDRLFGSGLVTTLFGLAALVFTGSLIWTGKSTPSELSGWFAFGCMLLRSKDSILGLHLIDEEKNGSQ